MRRDPFTERVKRIELLGSRSDEAELGADVVVEGAGAHAEERRRADAAQQFGAALAAKAGRVRAWRRCCVVGQGGHNFTVIAPARESALNFKSPVVGQPRCAAPPSDDLTRAG
jgi:hypothetical protein